MSYLSAYTEHLTNIQLDSNFDFLILDFFVVRISKK